MKLGIICSSLQLISAVLLAVLTVGLCDTDLTQVLRRAAHKYAWDCNTMVDTSTLAGGFCFAASDLSQGEQSCSSQRGEIDRLFHQTILLKGLQVPLGSSKGTKVHKECAILRSPPAS